MEDQTFRSRLVELMKKGRKATRIYSSIHKGIDPASRHIDSQTEQWREMNSELLRLLSVALDRTNNRKLAVDVQVMRDRFEQEWRRAADEMQSEQARLLTAAQNGDFIRSAVLAEKLVAVKARFQAAQAVHHEIVDVLKKSRIAEATIELSESCTIVEEGRLGAQQEASGQQNNSVQKVRIAKVIPITRRNVS